MPKQHGREQLPDLMQWELGPTALMMAWAHSAPGLEVMLAHSLLADEVSHDCHHRGLPQRH